MLFSHDILKRFIRLVISSRKDLDKALNPIGLQSFKLRATQVPGTVDWYLIFSSQIDVGKNTTLNFVAAQSPLEKTVDNFWQMIWENGIHFCIMVTREEVGVLETL